MATAYTQSMNDALEGGMVDGSMRSPNPNRGGVIEPTTQARRGSLHFDQYGTSCGGCAEGTRRPDTAEHLPPQHNLPSPL